MPPQVGGDAGLRGEAEGTDGKVAPHRHGAGCEAGSQPGGILAERHVSDVVQGFDLPVAADQPRELGGCGLSRGETGDDSWQGRLQRVAGEEAVRNLARGA
ncbi:hypothetical protein ABZY09_20210 [Streptomyces sp. NPDC002928]|uniref:hypothetical protein n=1 Tax=Streptomyces sp. NPDC002928 TaxID=3154440 RepID=UPI0033ABF556